MHARSYMSHKASEKSRQLKVKPNDSQLFLVIRYVDIEVANVKIEEHFLCFIEANSSSSENLVQHNCTET